MRDHRFPRDFIPKRWWLGNDPVASAWFNALSATFPRGEAFFIESVKAFRDGTPYLLHEDIRAFIRQEVNHSREHLAFNRMAELSGYDLSRLDAQVATLIAMTKDRPAIVNLAATMALEHFTAMLAHEFIETPQHLENADPMAADLWRWHSIEEIEHKAVAYDTWLHATKDWDPGKSWRLKSIMMLAITKKFIVGRWIGALDLLAQDGITGIPAKRRLLWYLLGKPGILRRLIPDWLAYFMPYFHPWHKEYKQAVRGIKL